MFIKIAEIDFSDNIFEIEKNSIIENLKNKGYEIVCDPDFKGTFYLIRNKGDNE